jgi:hypothetical protein
VVQDMNQAAQSHVQVADDAKLQKLGQKQRRQLM